MKTEQWLAVFAVFVACGKSAESKQDKTDKPTKTDKTDKPDKGPAGPFAGFYRVKSATMNGKVIELAEAFEQSLKSSGDAKLEIDLVRMTIEIEGDKLTVGVDQVWGSPGSATFCSVHGASEATLAGTKLTVPTIDVVAFAGVVSSKGDSNNKDTAKCNASLKGGTYEVKVSGKAVDISTTTGDPVTLHLVPDDKAVDLKARAVAFAARK